MLMAPPLAQIQEDIQALSDAEKGALLRVLWEELDGASDPDVDAAWLAEAKRRDQEIEDRVVDTIPADEVFRSLEASLKK
jgi:Putative addiction module component